MMPSLRSGLACYHNRIDAENSRAKQRRNEYRLPSRHARSCPCVDAGDLLAGHKDTENEGARLQGPSLSGEDGNLPRHEVQRFLMDDIGDGEPPAIPPAEARGKPHATTLALEIRLDDVTRPPEAPGIERRDRDVITDRRRLRGG